MKEKLYVTIREDVNEEVGLLEYRDVEFTLKNGVYSCDNLSLGNPRGVYLSPDFKRVYSTSLYYDTILIDYQVEAISSKPPKHSKFHALAQLRRRYLREITSTKKQYEMMKKWVMEGEK